MRRFLPVGLIALLSLTSATWPGHAQDMTTSVDQSGHTPAAPNMVYEPGIFSYQAPQGWTVKDTAYSKYLVSSDAPKNNFSANVNVVKESFTGSLDQYVAANSANVKASSMIKNVRIVDQKPFTTTAGLPGVRVTMNDTVGQFDLEQFIYFFAGTGDAKFVVTATCRVQDGPAYEPIFDQCLKTFTLH